MSLYDGIKDVAKLVQRADNIDLYRQLLDLSSQALDLQAENARLREENAELRKYKNIESNIEYYLDPFITLKTDTKPILYCAACWVDKKKLIPIQDQGHANYVCPLCNARIVDMRLWSHRKQND